MAKTHSLAQVVKMMPAPSERWLLEKIRKGQFPARKIGRHWRMSNQDVLDALDTLKNDPDVANAPRGLTPRSRLRASHDRLENAP